MWNLIGFANDHLLNSLLYVWELIKNKTIIDGLCKSLDTDLWMSWWVYGRILGKTRKLYRTEPKQIVKKVEQQIISNCCTQAGHSIVT